MSLTTTSAVSLAPIMTNGTPFPGRVDAPTRYRLRLCGCRIRGRSAESCCDINTTSVIYIHTLYKRIQTAIMTFLILTGRLCARPKALPRNIPKATCQSVGERADSPIMCPAKSDGIPATLCMRLRTAARTFITSSRSHTTAALEDDDSGGDHSFT